MTTLTNPDSWADLHTLVDCSHYSVKDDIKYLVIDFPVPEENTSTTRTLLRRILREINRKIILIDSTYEAGTYKLKYESVYTNITEEDWNLAREYFVEKNDCEYEESFVLPCSNRDHNNSSPSDVESLSQQSDSSEDEPSPQPVL